MPALQAMAERVGARRHPVFEQPCPNLGGGRSNILYALGQVFRQALAQASSMEHGGCHANVEGAGNMLKRLFTEPRRAWRLAALGAILAIGFVSASPAEAATRSCVNSGRMRCLAMQLLRKKVM